MPEGACIPALGLSNKAVYQDQGEGEGDKGKGDAGGDKIKSGDQYVEAYTAIHISGKGHSNPGWYGFQKTLKSRK